MNKEKNLLDLRPKVEPEIKIVEKIVLKKRGFPVELFKMLVVIAVCSLIVWGISRADNIANSAPKNFGATGIVSSIGSTTISISNAQGGDSGVSSYTFDTQYLKKIETNDYTPVSLGEINTGDRIVAQGVSTGGSLQVRRIVLFASPDAIATTTDTIIATTTVDVSPTTDVVTPVSSSTTPDDTTASSTLDTSLSNTDTSTSTTDSVSTTTQDTGATTTDQ